MGKKSISRSFTDAERERFHNLLTLAAESPFDGERENALSAARRMAEKCGMSLEEAALASGPAQPKQPPPPPQATAESRFARAAHLMDYHLHIDKMRRDAALAEARSRGLDADQPEKSRLGQVKRTSRARMNPWRHARVLLSETSLPFQEIATITGLSIYQVVGMKLKMRRAA